MQSGLFHSSSLKNISACLGVNVGGNVAVWLGVVVLVILGKGVFIISGVGDRVAVRFLSALAALQPNKTQHNITL